MKSHPHLKRKRIEEVDEELARQFLDACLSHPEWSRLSPCSHDL